MIAVQLDFFEPMPDEIDVLRSQIIELTNMAHAVRKKSFAEINCVKKELVLLKDQVVSQESRITALEKILQKNTSETLTIESIFGKQSK